MAESSFSKIQRLLKATIEIADAAREIAILVRDALRAVKGAAHTTHEALSEARATVEAVHDALDELGVLVRELCPDCRGRYTSASVAAAEGAFDQVAERVGGMYCDWCANLFRERDVRRRQEGGQALPSQANLLSRNMTA